MLCHACERFERSIHKEPYRCYPSRFPVHRRSSAPQSTHAHHATFQTRRGLYEVQRADLVECNGAPTSEFHAVYYYRLIGGRRAVLSPTDEVCHQNPKMSSAIMLTIEYLRSSPQGITSYCWFFQKQPELPGRFGLRSCARRHRLDSRLH